MSKASDDLVKWMVALPDDEFQTLIDGLNAVGGNYFIGLATAVKATRELAYAGILPTPESIRAHVEKVIHE